jgi:hypothetical protein
LNCRKATRLLSEAQDRELSLKEKISLRLHTIMCAGCRNFGVQMKALRHFARAYAKGEDDSSTDGKSREK